MFPNVRVCVCLCLFAVWLLLLCLADCVCAGMRVSECTRECVFARMCACVWVGAAIVCLSACACSYVCLCVCVCAAGKTTLLDVLALRKATGTLQGDLLVNGSKVNRTQYR